jgi:RNA polymerase sigma factor (sigma-70 family)
MTIYRNLCQERNKKKIPTVPLTDENQIPSGGHGAKTFPEDDPNRDLLDILKNCWKNLRDTDKDLLSLRYVEGLSLVKIGNGLNIKVETVKTRLFRARENLKSLAARVIKESK